MPQSRQAPRLGFKLSDCGLRRQQNHRPQLDLYRSWKIEKRVRNQWCGWMRAPRSSSLANRKQRKLTSKKRHKVRCLQFRTEITQSRASENFAEREGNSGLAPNPAMQRSLSEPRGYWGFRPPSRERRIFCRKQLAEGRGFELPVRSVFRCFPFKSETACT